MVPPRAAYDRERIEHRRHLSGAVLIERHGERFERRVFTPAEISYCRRKRHPFLHYSARFAAKEAAAKALGTGFGRGIRFTDIAIENEGTPPGSSWKPGAGDR